MVSTPTPTPALQNADADGNLSAGGPITYAEQVSCPAVLLSEGRQLRSIKRKLPNSSLSMDFDEEEEPDAPEPPLKKSKLDAKPTKPKSKSATAEDEDEEQLFDWSTYSVTIYPFTRVKQTVQAGTKKNIVPRRKLSILLMNPLNLLSIMTGFNLRPSFLLFLASSGLI